MTQKQVSIYTTPNCVYCRMTKEFFNANKINYQEYDVVSDLERRREMFEKSKQMGVPVIRIVDSGGKEEIIVGFDKPKLAAALL